MALKPRHSINGHCAVKPMVWPLEIHENYVGPAAFNVPEFAMRGSKAGGLLRIVAAGGSNQR